KACAPGSPWGRRKACHPLLVSALFITPSRFSRSWVPVAIGAMVLTGGTIAFTRRGDSKVEKLDSLRTRIYRSTRMISRS
ncbi:hypothetical protein WG66_008414, partial [Moniliophthora roreri]